MNASLPQTGTKTEHFDMLIVGAGISGIGSAYHMKTQCPDKNFVILEAKDTFGGTWVTHKYPGVRSDSDLYTFGYRFKPWVGHPIATADQILKYVGEVITENNIDQHIRYGHKITRCAWSSEHNLWTVQATRLSDGTQLTFTANFLWMCQGYYDHDTPYTPEWPGMADFKGPIIHPMKWPENSDLSGKKVVVIGSGATAATLIPAIANVSDHVTMLQRTPTWFLAQPNVIEIADTMRAIGIDEPTIHRVVRAKVNFDHKEANRRAHEEPEALREELFAAARVYLGENYDMAPHFTPNYRVWQQRVAFLPDGDMFQSIAAGKASVVTDHIERFTPSGILLKSGKELAADVIVTATGFNLAVLGNIPFDVDGKAVNWADTINYRGMMFTGVPNLVWIFGYFRASWTLRVDLVGDFVCSLLKQMDGRHAKRIDVKLRPEDKDMAILPWISEENFNPGYLAREMHKMPKRGDKREWQHTQDYWNEKDEFPAIDLNSTEFSYS
jgi:monooxygenase